MSRGRASILLACVAASLCLIGTCAAPALGHPKKKGSEADIHFVLESAQAYERQLAAGQIRAAKFDTKTRSMHLTLADGRHFRVTYPPHGEARLVSALQAHGVSVPAIKKGNTIHHKLRYIAAGVLVVVLLGIGAILLLRRRRAALADY